MSIFTGEELVEFVSEKIGIHYVFGVKPWWGVLTYRHIEYLVALYPDIFSEDYLKLMSPCIGKICTDCSGLICWYTGVAISSTQMYEQASERHEIDMVDISNIKKGCILWKPGHVGVYIGNGECIEARGVKYGTLKTSLQERYFTHWLMLQDFVYDNYH